MQYRFAQPNEDLAISILLSDAFQSPSEARLVKNLREQGDMALEMVAEEDGRLIGYIAYSHFQTPANWVALGPLAVRMGRQSAGVGGALLLQSLDVIRRENYDAIVVLGIPDYYRRFGFSLQAASKLKTPYSLDFTMMFPLRAGTAGSAQTLTYARAFDS